MLAEPTAQEATVTDDAITLFHAPQSRSTGAVVLLEELGAPYTLRVLNMKAGEQRQPDYLAINPLGKVPAVLHQGTLITEQVAIFIYLSDLFPAASLAPALTDKLRGSYLRWLVFYAACYEAGLVDNAMKRAPAPPAMSPYGSFETVLATLFAQLRASPYLLGGTICAADILWGHALSWGMEFGLVARNAEASDYVARVTQRPAALKVAESDRQLAAEQAQAAN